MQPNFNLLPPSGKKLKILEHMSGGMQYEQIAGIIFLSDLTIKSYVRDMKKKYDCETATGLVCLAIAQNWIKNLGKE